MKTVAVAEDQALNLIDNETAGELIVKMEKLFRQDIKTMASDALPEKIENTEEQKILEEILQDRKDFISRVQELYLPLKEDANRAHKTITKSEGKMIEVADAQREHIVAVLSDFQTRKVREAEKERAMAHALAVAEAERKKAEELARLKTLAASAEKIEAVISAPLEVVVQKVPSVTEGLGARYTKTVTGTVNDLKSFLQAIIEGKIPEQVIEIRTAKLNALIKAGVRHSSITVVEELRAS